MRRTSLAALLAAPALLAVPGPATANYPRQCYGGFCMSLGSKLHQHGPLFNYGPYYGYPPFEPYGPWNAYLQYNPWYYGVPGGHGGHHRDGLGGHFRGLCGKNGCGPGDRLHACFKDGGWFRGHGCLSCGHRGKRAAGAHDGCPPCESADPCTTDPLTRCAGVGRPAEAAVFYAGLPSLDPSAAK